jgi:hypothetical protein
VPLGVSALLCMLLVYSELLIGRSLWAASVGEEITRKAEARAAANVCISAGIAMIEMIFFFEVCNGFFFDERRSGIRRWRERRDGEMGGQGGYRDIREYLNSVA